MNAIHVHLAISHVPVVGTGLTLFLFAIGWLKKNDEIIKISFLMFILLALSAVATFFSGEASEEIAETIPGILENMINHHEESAKLSMVVVMVAGSVGLLGLIFSFLKKNIPTWLKLIFAIIGIGSGGLLVRTANLGGQIRHDEIRSSSTAVLYGEDEKEADGNQTR